jgi:hypothetical protein
MSTSNRLRESVDYRLGKAAGEGDLASVIFLIREDDASDISSALLEAASQGHTEVVRYLLSTDYVTSYDYIINACTEAVKKGNLRLVKLILSYIPSEYFDRCLDEQIGSEEVARYLMDFSQGQPEFHQKVIRATVYSGFLGLLEEEKFTVKQATELLLLVIPELSRADILYFLLKNGAKIEREHLRSYTGNNFGIFKYLLNNIPLGVSLRETVNRYSTLLSRNANERIFDLVSRISSPEGYEGRNWYPRGMIVGAVKSGSVRNFWKVFDSEYWGGDHELIGNVLEHQDVAVELTPSDEIFNAVIPYVKDYEKLAYHALMKDRLDRFEIVFSIVVQQGVAKEDFYNKIFNTVMSRDNVGLAARILDLGVVTSGDIGENVRSLEMLRFIESRTPVSEEDYARILRTALTSGLIKFATYCYEKLNPVFARKKILEMFRKIRINREAYRFLLDHGVKPNDIIVPAVRSESLRSIELAIERGANLKSIGTYPIEVANDMHGEYYAMKVRRLLGK